MRYEAHENAVTQHLGVKSTRTKRPQCLAAVRNNHTNSELIHPLIGTMRHNSPRAQRSDDVINTVRFHNRRISKNDRIRVGARPGQGP